MGTARMMGETCIIRLRTEYPEKPRGNIYLDRRVQFTLLDTEGKTIHPRSTRTSGSRGGRNHTMQFQVKGAKPAKLQFKWLAEHEEQDVTFKFENLPLP